MILVKDQMRVVDVKRLAPRCKQMKISLDGVSYKRIVFEYKEDSSIQWLHNGEFVSEDTEKILEKIFSEIESD